MTLGQIPFKLHETQKRTDGRTDGWTRVNLNTPPPIVGAQKRLKAILLRKYIQHIEDIAGNLQMHEEF
jgi:hypothetical protein